MKQFDYSVVRDRKTYKALVPIGKILRRLMMKVNYIGLENIPKDGGFILASNHIMSIDPFFFATGFPRTMHFMGKQELFDNPFVNFFFTHLNGFPISRGTADKTAVEYSIKIVEQGGVLGIFPEGTRSKDLKPAQGKSGVALIAKAAKADILPVSIYASEKPKFRSRLTIRVGEMIPYEELGLTDGERSTRELRDASRMIMGRITALWELRH
ncbi:MAG: 1-acyl-sn-glycerol-3-phosphate acyltransferase [Oscillospiraceae bacterium]|nr:1-acyl-sn-glycerol-3-phosphate acyltransferase [Oscillospiraceae bacterium]